MTNRVLVTYASRTGATVGVAEAIGKTLSENGLEVEVRPMSEVTNLTPYDAVVAGSAIQSRQWLPEAMQFMRTYQPELTHKPFAAFLVCMTLAMKNKDYQSAVAQWLEPVRSLVRPMSEGLFAGALDISKVPSFTTRLQFRISVALGVWTEGDHRDWTAIHAWANKLALKLK
jgi:menaquinone-dependent protoporphyrinogen oxidase